MHECAASQLEDVGIADCGSVDAHIVGLWMLMRLSCGTSEMHISEP